MKKQSGFSLIETTMAVGVAAFCLTTLTGLILTGLHSNEKSEDKCMALDVAAILISDLKNALKATDGTTQTVDCLTIPEAGSSTDTEQIIYYSKAADSTGGHFAVGCSSSMRYRIAVSMYPPGAKQHRATFVHLRVTWPAEAQSDMAHGSVEVASFLDRN